MPRLKRRSIRRTTWTAAHRRALKHRDWLGVFRDDADMRAAWDEMRDRILAEWIQERPGTRPWCWWKFDMPAGTRRERIDGGVHPHDHASPVDPRRRLFRGKPARIAEADRDALYESEESFLRRYGLLSDDESEALQKMER